MAQATTLGTTIDERAEKKAGIRLMLAEMDRLLAEMQEDRVEMKRLREETRLTMNDIDATLARLAAS